MRKLTLALLLVLMTFTLAAQKKQYDSLTDAFRSEGALRGDRGPAGVEWIDANKYINLKIYPPGTHGVAYDMNSRMHLYNTYLDWLNKNLKGTE